MTDEDEMDKSTVNKHERKGNSCLKLKLIDIIAYFKEYCDAAGLHGVRYLSEDRRNLFEKVFWFTALILCAVGCAFMIAKVKAKLDTTPVIVTFAESETNIWQLPFPAVTVCPYTKYRSEYFNFTEFIRNYKNNSYLYVAYDAWLKKIFIVMHSELKKEFKLDNKLDAEKLKRLFASNKFTMAILVGRSINDHSKKPKRSVYKKVYPYIFADFVCEELDNLLDEMYSTINHDFRTTSSTKIVSVNTSLTWFSEDGECSLGTNICKSIQGYYDIWTDEVKQKINALCTVCQLDDDENFAVGLLTKLNSSSTLDETAMEFLKKVSPSSVIHKAIWEDNTLNRKDSRQTWTAGGSCLTLNGLDDSQIYRENAGNLEAYPSYETSPSDWDPDVGYSATAGLNTFPRRSLGIGERSGVTVQFIEEIFDIDYECNTGFTGYKVFLHHAQTLPQSATHSVEVPLGKRVSISIHPNVLTTSPELKNYDPHDRQCYLSHERPLEYFKFYSKENCMLECEATAVLKKCGCVAFYMPRNASTNVCSRLSYSCMKNAKKDMEEHEVDVFLKKLPGGRYDAFNTALTKTECDCLPSCLSVNYDSESSVSDWDYMKTSKYWEKGSKSTIISVFYKDNFFIASRRSALYGTIEFFANCGGLLGLFSGFSIISLIEIVYFLTLRLWSNLFRRWATSRKIHQIDNNA